MNTTPEKGHFKAFSLMIDSFMFLFGLFAAIFLLLGLYANQMPYSTFLLYCGVILVPVFFVNLLLVVYSLFRKKFFLLIINLIPLLLGVAKVLQLPSSDVPKENSTPVKVISYNVQSFNTYVKKDPSLEGIAFFMDEEKPDIICFQEFAWFSSRKNITEYMSEKYNVCKEGQFRWKTINGLAIFTRYPIIRSEAAYGNDSLPYMMYCDLLIGADSIRVFNLHLQTTNLNQTTKGFSIESMTMNRRSVDVLKTFNENAVQRISQADTIASVIASSPYPVIVCGDFNDTPFSYSYKILSENLLDAFYEAGIGYSYTYNGFMKSMRIDYILYNREWAADSYDSPHLNFSDHNPVMTTLWIPNK